MHRSDAGGRPTYFLFAGILQLGRYDNHDPLKQHLQTFLATCTEAKRLKTLNRLTPNEYICKCWTETLDRFRRSPLHHTLGLNTDLALKHRAFAPV